jgi:hypothetical protein
MRWRGDISIADGWQPGGPGMKILLTRSQTLGIHDVVCYYREEFHNSS